MVCDDCKSKLSSLATGDPFKGGSSGGPASSRQATNTLLRRGVTSNPYGHHCSICKQRCQVQGATFCTICAYAKGVCAICGKQVLDISMYKMSEGGGFNAVRAREQKAYKSAAQIAREEAQAELFAHLAQVGQVGKMPTKAALEAAGKKELAAALVAGYGGLHAAADAMGLSKRQLNEEAELRKEAKAQAAQKAAERARLAPPREEAPSAAPADDDLPPGVTPRAAAPRAAVAPPPPPPPAAPATPTSWEYDPNSGLYFQLSSRCYYDLKAAQFFKDGVCRPQRRVSLRSSRERIIIATDAR
ncbi:hypothetical protein AB1Y20_006936 [Prymnesium parvum]|uniref:Cysteine-rich PDZ-binding protein n=1 Tax=Prymnesium parvum TaxID=97485 RepID=A0AB34J235_PRYPA